MIIRMAAQEAMVTSTGSAAMVLRGNTTIQGPGWLSIKSTCSNGILVIQPYYSLFDPIYTLSPT